jgi:hypothetical protein
MGDVLVRLVPHGFDRRVDRRFSARLEGSLGGLACGGVGAGGRSLVRPSKSGE